MDISEEAWIVKWFPKDFYYLTLKQITLLTFWTEEHIMVFWEVQG
jgi:hypothetical protein